MKQYTVYNTDTGEILRVLLQAKPPSLEDGLSFIEGNYPDDQFDIVDGQPVSNPKDTRRVAPKPEAQQKSEITDEEKLRLHRNTLLQQSDWTQVSDAPVDQAAWAAYRQALRDLPANTSDPANPVWPSKPQ